MARKLKKGLHNKQWGFQEEIIKKINKENGQKLRFNHLKIQKDLKNLHNLCMVEWE